MASTGSSEPEDKAGRRVRPGPPTIDLSATEVAATYPAAADAAAANAAAGDGAAEGSPPESAASEGAPSPATEAAAESAPPADTGPVAPPGGPPRRDPEEPPGLPPPKPSRAGAVLGTTALILVLLLAAGLWWTGAFTREDTAPLARRLAQVEQRLGQIGARPDPQPIADLTARLAAAEEALRRLDAMPARLAALDQATRRLDELSARLDAVEQTRRDSSAPPAAPAAPQAAARPDDSPPAIDSLGRRLDELDRRLAAVEPAVRGLPDLTARLGKVESGASAPRPAAPERPAPRPAAGERPIASEAEKAIAERVAAAEAALKSLTEGVASLDDARRTAQKWYAEGRAAAETALQSLDARLAELTQRTEQANTAAEQATAAAEQAATAARAAEAQAGQEATQRQAQAAQETTQRQADARSTRAIKLALTTAALRDAVARGEPYAGELKAVQVVAGVAEFAPLEPFAAEGVPSAATLAHDLLELVPTLHTRAAPPAPGGGGMLDRLQAGADRLVRVRPLTGVTGEDPDAIVTRVEAKARAGDVDGALLELTTLPADVRAPAEDWIKRAEARRAALSLANGLAREAASAIGKD